MTETSEKRWIYPNGMGADGRPLFEPQSTEDLAQLASGQTRAAKQAHAASLQELHGRHRSKGEAHFGVKQGIHPEKLEETGWGVILPATKQGSPEAAAQREILDALQPLLDWRREQATRNHENHFRSSRVPAATARARPSSSTWRVWARGRARQIQRKECLIIC